MVKQLLFAEGLVGLGGVVGRPRSTWWDRAVAALSRYSRPGLQGGVGMGWLKTARSGINFVTAPSLLFDPSALLRSTHYALRGSTTCNPDSDYSYDDD
eukprot:355617-Chlamydomonas_euryale.AAC.18